MRVRVREGTTRQGWTIQEQFGFGVRHEVSRRAIGGTRKGPFFFFSVYSTRQRRQDTQGPYSEATQQLPNPLETFSTAGNDRGRRDGRRDTLRKKIVKSVKKRGGSKNTGALGEGRGREAVPSLGAFVLGALDEDWG